MKKQKPTRLAHLKMLDASMLNFKKGKVSKPIDLSAFDAKAGEAGQIMTPQLAALVNEVAAYLRREGAKEVFLFGSSVRAGVQEVSDIDLAVSGLDPAKFYHVAGVAEDMLGKPLDLVDLDEQTPFIRALKGNGQLVEIRQDQV